MFHFSLQVALNVRSRQEKIKMKELAEALAIEQMFIKEIDQIFQNTAQADQNLNRMKMSNTFSIEQMKSLSHFKSRMKVVLARCQQDLQGAQHKVAEQQKILIEASKARKTLEILREKESRKYQEKITRLERKSMDEIAGNLFIRHQREGQSST